MAEEQEPGVPNVFTDAQLEEFKEQDRYLPVSLIGWRQPSRYLGKRFTFHPALLYADRECWTDHEERFAF
jgi:hypothetical protein